MGLLWSSVDFRSNRIHIEQQLYGVADDGSPRFGQTKTGKPRAIDLMHETILALQAHLRTQGELRLRTGGVYRDHGLVFSKADGAPAPNFGQYVKRICKDAGIKQLSLHSCRHTSATLLLTNGEALNVVSGRLGHASANVTLAVYTHFLPTMGASAARRMSDILHGTSEDAASGS